MALAERLQNDTGTFLKNTRNWVNKKMYSTKACNSKWAAVNDGDDGEANDDEDAVNNIWVIESFKA